jgi:ring-1,2-phenylacetyl-CoA epoxidase subunit PaaE
MSLHFVPLQIADIRKETSDCVSIAFDIPADKKALFRFIQGQNITVRAKIDNRDLRRSYSICSAVQEDQLRIAVKRVPGGLFSEMANRSLKKGDWLEVLPPTGQFHVTLNPHHKKHYLAIAAGSGITPVLSIIKTTLHTEPESQFTLIYGNRSRASIIFFEELEALKNKYMDRFQLIHILSRERVETSIHFGRIDERKCAELQGKLVDFDRVDEIFICGPEAMIFSARDWLLQNGIEKRKIHIELFNTPGQNKQQTAKPESTGERSAKAMVTIKQDGRSFDFELSYNDDSILDGALKQGADLPYACKGGVCATCRARLLEGQVQMDANWALEPEELEHGFILTCQSHPVSPRIVVDFDAR